MSKAQRASSAPTKSNKASTEVTAKPLEGQHSNEFVAGLVELAAKDAGAEDKYLSLAADEGRQSVPEGPGEQFPPGFFDIAEDDTLKKQTAPLPGLRPEHEGTNKYETYEKGAAFVKGEGDDHEVAPNDVKQGSLGNCYLMAGMAAVARANPDAIKKLIKDNGDGTFEVTLYIRDTAYGTPKPQKVTIDGQFASKFAGTPLYAKVGDDDGEKQELWAPLLEKALAQKKGSYDKISGGNIAKDGFNFAGATEMFTGKREGYFATSSLDEDDALLMIDEALDKKKPVTCDSKNMESDAAMSKEATAVNVYGNHAYAPMAVDLSARTIDLQNPWGSSHVSALPVKDFMRFYRAVRIGA